MEHFSVSEWSFYVMHIHMVMMVVKSSNIVNLTNWVHDRNALVLGIMFLCELQSNSLAVFVTVHQPKS